MPAKSDTRIDALRLIAPLAGSDSVSAEQLQRLAGVGSEIVTSFLVIPPLPLRGRWIAHITAFEWNQFFDDDQVRGPFKGWHHRHGITDMSLRRKFATACDVRSCSTRSITLSVWDRWMR